MTFAYPPQLALWVATIALAATPAIGLAASPSPKPAPSTTAQVTPGRGSALMEQLNLTADQKQKIRQLQSDKFRQIQAVLTPAQRTQFLQALKAGKKTGQSLQTLNLNADQKKKIGSIVQASNKKLMGILNQKQRQQLAAYLKQQRQASNVPIE